MSPFSLDDLRISALDTTAFGEEGQNLGFPFGSVRSDGFRICLADPKASQGLQEEQAFFAQAAARHQRAAVIGLTGSTLVDAEKWRVTPLAPALAVHCGTARARSKQEPVAGSKARDNGARGLAALVVTHENPADLAEFLSAATDQREMVATSLGLDLTLAMGRKLLVITPPAFTFLFGREAPSEPCVSGLIFRSELAQTRDYFHQHSMALRPSGDRLTTFWETAGLALAFEADQEERVSS